MEKISEETIDHIAHLSRLRFEGDDKVAIRQDLDKIIGFMGKLSEIPTDDVEPLSFKSLHGWFSSHNSARRRILQTRSAY